jgi:hypothetical protein
MKIATIPESLIFDEQDSIPVVFNCSYKDSALCCGNGEVYSVIDETLNFDRLYKDSTYVYSHCACNDTIYLKGLNRGDHFISGNLTWNAGDWTYGKNRERKVHIK